MTTNLAGHHWQTDREYGLSSPIRGPEMPQGITGKLTGNMATRHRQTDREYHDPSLVK
jgi:hypothetical protein